MLQNKSIGAILALGILLSSSVSAQVVLSNQFEEVSTLSGAAYELYGKSELRITGSGTPISGCTINLHSVDSWVFLPAVQPSSAATLLGQFQVNGASAVLNNNVKVVQYGQGAVIIPYPSGFKTAHAVRRGKFQWHLHEPESLYPLRHGPAGEPGIAGQLLYSQAGVYRYVCPECRWNRAEQELCRRGWRSGNRCGSRVDGRPGQFCPCISLALDEQEGILRCVPHGAERRLAL